MAAGTLGRYPVTILMGAQYAALVVVPAIVHRTEPFGLILRICFAATVAAFVVEFVIAHPPVRVGQRDRIAANMSGRQVSLGVSYFVLVVGMAADIGATIGGVGNYSVQVGADVSSAFVTLLTPFRYWELFGSVLIIWAYRQNRITRRRALLVLAVVVAARLYAGIYTAILADSLSFIACLTILAVLLGLIRVRWVIIGLLLIPILWPPIYGLRNQKRQEFTRYVVDNGDASARLRLDLEMANIARLVPKPSVITTPSALDLFRFGLIPRVIDSGRADIETGSQFSVALGSTVDSSQTATMLGNAYVFGGWTLVILVPAGIALSMAIAIRRNTPWGYMYAGMIWLYCLSFSAAWPTMVIVILQATESLAFAAIVVYCFSRHKKDHPEPALFSRPPAPAEIL